MATLTEWNAAIASSGRRKTVVDVVIPPSSIGSPDTVLVKDVPIIDGSISVDRNSSNRRSVTLTIGKTDLIPKRSSDAFQPYGAEMIIRSGVIYGYSGEELLPQGRFIISSVSWQDTARGAVLKVTAFDRAKTIQRSLFTVPQDYSGQMAKTVITGLISGAAPGHQSFITASLTDYKLPGGTIFEGDRWSAVQKIVEGFPAEAYYDVNGTLQVVPIPIVDSNTLVADYTIETGAVGTLITADRSIDREGTYSHVLVFGAAPTNGTAQAFGEAKDTDTQSPTYYLGPFGDVPLRIDNSLLTTNAQCLAVANSRLRDATGLGYSVDLSILPNPRLDAGNVILVKFGSGDSQFHLIDSVTIPLGAGAMTVATKTNIHY